MCNEVVLKHLFDFTLSLLAFIILAIPMMIIALAVKLSSHGPIFYWSDRIGKNNIIFKMPKFHTMRSDTPAVARHLLDDRTAG